jgi:hypothetical protein
MGQGRSGEAWPHGRLLLRAAAAVPKIGTPYEYGGSLDLVGREAEAVIFYEPAFAARLDEHSAIRG